ncbi:MAG: hypothetical protein ABR970_09165, partial [Roseiarcus sp.]
MTAIALPAPTLPAPTGVGAAYGPPGDRAAGSQSDSGEGSAFGSVLGSLDEPAPQAAPANGSPGAEAATAAASANIQGAASWRTVSAVHALGSGVLVALDRRLDPAASPGLPGRSDSARPAWSPQGRGARSRPARRPSTRPRSRRRRGPPRRRDRRS